MVWERGSSVAVRSRPDGVIGYCLPAIVVADTDRLVALFQPEGTVCKRRTGRRSGPRGRNLLAWDGSHEDIVTDYSSLHVWVPDDAYWVICGWDGAAFDGFYINLAEPWRRTAIGFDTADRILDIVVSPDRSSWEWKDEDELAWAVQASKVTTQQAAEVRRQGTEAVVRMQNGAPPFHEWSDLQPDPGWSVPMLPTSWNQERPERAALE